MLTDEIQDALKKGKVILGFRKSIRYIKMYKPKLVVVANNIPESMKREIKYNTKIGKIKMKVFKGSSKKLGIICGKPFPVSTLVIKE